jgi:hypothetical protein
MLQSKRAQLAVMLQICETYNLQGGIVKRIYIVVGHRLAAIECRGQLKQFEWFDWASHDLQLKSMLKRAGAEVL